MDNLIPISDDQLKNLIDNYQAWIEKNEKEKLYPELQRQRDKEIKNTLLNKKYLEETQEDEIVKKLLEYIRTLDGPVQRSVNLQRVQDAINNIRKNILYLIESEDGPVTKASNIIDGKDKIKYFSKAFWTPILSSLYPMDLPNWNNKTERFLTKLGVNVKKRGLKFEDKYKLISDSFKYLNKLDSKQDFFSLNHLMHYGTEIQEGKDLIRNMTGEIGAEDISYWRIIQPYREEISVWPLSREKKFIALGYPNHPNIKYVTDFKRMKKGDKVIPYLKDGRVGGIGTVVGEYEDYTETRPKEKDYFSGDYFRRRSVSWDNLPDKMDYWKIVGPPLEIVPGVRKAVHELTKEQYEGIIENLGIEAANKAWIEKTYVTGVPHRESGERAYGKAIWSPRTSQDGKDIYKNMRMVSNGDIIIHLIDNERISGVSVVKSESYNEVSGLADTEWSGPAYLLDLSDFRELKPAIETKEILNENNKKRLQKIKSEGEVFYTSNLELRQGAYLTSCSSSLLTLINGIYKEKTKENLPHISTNMLEVREDIEGEVNYFWITANPKIWRVSTIFNGGEVDYTTINRNGNKRRIYSAFEAAKPWDKIIFYESTPIKKVIGVGTVTKGLFKGKEPGFSDEVEKIRIKFDAKITELTWEELKNIPALSEAEPIKAGAQGSLFHLTKDEFDIITSVIEEEPVDRFYPQDRLDVKELVDSSKPFKIKELYFENTAIIEEQISKSIANGKHIILIGPPGTGKSKLAIEVCKHYVAENYIPSSASSDWSTFDTIGGYIPDENGTLYFNPGIFLKCLQDNFDNPANNWLIIDEINRADIDKAFGALFSALTGDSVTLSYLKHGNQVQTIGKPSSSPIIGSHKYFIHPHWRIIATMNTFDKASLYEMSYAFMRRFAFIPIEIPSNITTALIEKYLDKWELASDQNVTLVANMWNIINKYRKIGPAIVQDIYKYLQSGGEAGSCIILYVLPQFEGIDKDQQIDFIKEMSQELDEAGMKRLKSFASDFFDTDIKKFSKNG